MSVSKMKNMSITDDGVELGNLKILRGIFIFLIISLIVMPQYFGIHIAVDFTCTRFADIFIVFYFICNPKVFNHFVTTSTRCEVLLPLGAYLVVAGYTMVFRVDINAFFMVFMEILTFFFLVYGIRYVVGLRSSFRIVIGCSYFLAVYGVVEYVCGQSLFHKFLSTVPNKVVNFYRSGHYRIMGPCGHSLGYGLLLLLLLAAACYDIEKDELYLLRRPVLFLLLLVNIFLTGSRSSLGFAVLEVFLIFCFSSIVNKKKSLFFLTVILFAFSVLVVAIQGTGLGQYILGQFASVIDQVFGTTFAANFGIDVQRLDDSTAYRAALPYIFTLDWLNPILGRGNKFSGAEIQGIFIESIDNYYVAQYIKFAYPGLVSFAIYLIVTLVVLIKGIIQKSNLAKMVLIGLSMYFISLWYVDALQTLKFSYLFVALFYAYWLKSKENRLK